MSLPSCSVSLLCCPIATNKGTKVKVHIITMFKLYCLDQKKNCPPICQKIFFKKEGNMFDLLVCHQIVDFWNILKLCSLILKESIIYYLFIFSPVNHKVSCKNIYTTFFLFSHLANINSFIIDMCYNREKNTKFSISLKMKEIIYLHNGNLKSVVQMWMLTFLSQYLVLCR